MTPISRYNSVLAIQMPLQDNFFDFSLFNQIDTLKTLLYSNYEATAKHDVDPKSKLETIQENKNVTGNSIIE